MAEKKTHRSMEAVRLVHEQDLSIAQAARDLDLHQLVLRIWVGDFKIEPQGY